MIAPPVRVEIVPEFPFDVVNTTCPPDATTPEVAPLLMLIGTPLMELDPDIDTVDPENVTFPLAVIDP